MKNYKNRQQGLSIIAIIIIVVFIIAILSWYGFDLKKFFTSDQAQMNFGYIGSFFSYIWTNFLVGPATVIWGIFIQYIWTPLLHIINK